MQPVSMVTRLSPSLCRQDCWSALICAAKEGHEEVVKELLENSAYIEHRDMVGTHTHTHTAEAHGTCSQNEDQSVTINETICC